MGAPPHRAVLQVVRPIRVATIWLLEAPKVSPLGTVTSQPGIGQPDTSQPVTGQLMPVNQALSYQALVNLALVNQALVI